MDKHQQKSGARLKFETEVINLARNLGGLEGGAPTGELGFWFVSWKGAERFKNLLLQTRPTLTFRDMGAGEGVRVIVPDDLQ